MNSTESPRGSASDSRRPPVKVGGPRSYVWRDMPNKILIPLQSLISRFLEPPANRRAAVGAIEGLWRGYSSVLLSPSSGYPSRWGFFCPYFSLFQESGQ